MSDTTPLLPENPGQPAVYFVPHQDDETLSMSVSIARRAAAGREVHVVLVTDGSRSGAFKNYFDCSPAGDTRYEKVACLTRGEFVEARNREFVAALKVLGVPSSRISFEGIVNNESTSASVGAIVDRYIARFGPSASYNTMSWLDMHVDHYALGYVLNNRCIRQGIPDCRFYQSDLYSLQHPGIDIGYPKVVTPRGWLDVPTPTELAAVRAAMDEFRRWDPQAGRYAIGWKYSVSKYFEYGYADARQAADWVHLDNAHWASIGDRTAARTWIDTVQKPNF